jgi:hypothetical protein
LCSSSEGLQWACRLCLPLQTFSCLYMNERRFFNLHRCRRVIDDGFAIWKHNEDRVTDLQKYKGFKKAINSGGLRWTFTDPSLKTDFMDLTVNIVGSKVTTNLYEKPLALHLYIPPHSCHPSSCFGSLVTGMVLLIYRLCTFQKDVAYWLRELWSLVGPKIPE